MSRAVLVGLVIGVVLLASLACGGATPHVPALTSTPTQIPTTSPPFLGEFDPTAPTPTSMLPPSDFVTFTDESDVFSISYPSHWELALSLMPEIEEITEDLIESKASGFPADKVGIVFFAGVPAPNAYLPSVNIVAESLPAGLSVEEYQEGSVEAARGLLSGFKVLDVFQVLVGNTDGLIMHAEFDISSFATGEVGKIRNIALLVVDGMIGWVVTCTLDSTEDLETCDAVVRTFKILQ